MSADASNVGFLLLVHEHPASWTGLVRRLLEAGSQVAVHLDADAPDAHRATLLASLADLPDVSSRLSWAERQAVRWGEWSMVEATLAGLACFEKLAAPPAHVVLLSGSDYPIRPLEQLADFLARHPGTDFIDHADPERVQWVQDGNQTERYRHWYFVNWRAHPRLFSALDALQRTLRIRRRPPPGLKPYIGSQWWTLSWKTCRAVLEKSRDPEIRRFFRWSWIPDELFFQTLVLDVADDAGDNAGDNAARVESRQLTHHLFTEYGVPLVFANGHEAYLSRQPFFFARKLSPHADTLRAQLDELARRGLPAPPEDEEVGRATGAYHRFIARHRHGPEGRWSWGRPPDPRLGDLSWNRRPYLVVRATDPANLAAALAILSQCPETRVHGRLFRPDTIGFADGAEHWQVYDAAATQIRDQDAPAFLADLLTDAGDRLLCFGWLEGEDGATSEASGGDLRQVLEQDPRGTWVQLGDPASAPSAGTAYRPSPRWVETEPEAMAEALRRLVESIPRPATPPAFLDATSEDAQDTLHRRQRLFIHIGVHRTGSTSIQQWLHRNRNALLEQGFLYPFAGVNHNDLARLMTTDPEAFQRRLHGLVDRATRSEAHTVILSAEDFSWLPRPGDLARLGKVFDVRVLCYVRRQDEWLESWYNQHVKWPWNRATSALTPEAFFAGRQAYQWIDYARTLERWRAAFGRRAITVRPFDEVRSTGSVVDDFAAFCGIDPSRLNAPQVGDNASVSAPALMLLRLLKLIDKPPAQRTELVRLVRATFDHRDAHAERHVLSPARRRAVVAEYEASNAAVARTYLGREDGVLFTAPLPADDPSPPPIALPPADGFREEIALPLVRRYLGRLLAVQRRLARNALAGELIAGKLRLLLLESIRQGLERELATPRELRDRLLRVGRDVPDIPRASPGLPRQVQDRLVADLGLDALGPAQARQLEECLAGWQGPPPERPEDGGGPADTEQLVTSALEPLLREFGWRLQTLKWLEALDQGTWTVERERLHQALEETETTVAMLRRDLSSRLRVALRLWRLRGVASQPGIF